VLSHVILSRLSEWFRAPAIHRHSTACAGVTATRGLDPIAGFDRHSWSKAAREIASPLSLPSNINEIG
jgi:hypothetical protein